MKPQTEDYLLPLEESHEEDAQNFPVFFFNFIIMKNPSLHYNLQ